MISEMDNEKNNESIRYSLENSEDPIPLSKAGIKKMSRKEKRHTDLPGNPVKGRKLFGWSRFFFVLTCIGTVLTGVMVFLPFFLIIFGLLSALIWIIYILAVTIFTLGMIWLSKDMQQFSGNWMDFNNTLFDSSNNAADMALKFVPFILISGAVVIGFTWMFLVLGRVFDEARKKKYNGLMIALGVISAIYIIFLIIKIFRMQVEAQTLPSSSSLIY